MINEPKHLNEYYSTRNEDDRLGTRHGSVEFLTTMRYIDKYLKPSNKIIEIGAGTGRFSHALAQKGYCVDAVELIEHNIELFKQYTRPGENITIVQGNVLDLSAFADETYDITLLLGPMYHLFTMDDKRQAISEALRVTKKGGVVFAAYIIAESSLINQGFKREVYSISDFIEKGLIDPVTFATSSNPEMLFELIRKDDIDEIMSPFYVARLHYVATDGLALHLRDEMESWDEAKFDLYLRYHYATCERQDMVGVTAHSLDIFRKH